MIILGLNSYHGDASACLIRDGQMVAAAEEERFRRIKHCAGFPSEAIRYCLAESNIPLASVDHIAVNSDPKAHLIRKLYYTLLHPPKLAFILGRVRNQKLRHSVELELDRAFPRNAFKGAVHRIEHHFSHLASCFLVSPFEEGMAVSIDGFGDFSSAAWGVGIANNITVDGRVFFPHSLGIFYQALTQFLGFPHYGDEYKVMGLAPYGEPRYLTQMRELVALNGDGTFALNTGYFRHHEEKIDYEWSDGAPSVGKLYSTALLELLGPARQGDEPLTNRHYDIARSAQTMYEEAFFHLLNALHARYRLDDLCLAGGCAMNSVANGKVRRRTRFKRVYVPAAAGDAGGAIGAAMHVWCKFSDNGGALQRTSSSLAGSTVHHRFVMDHAFWGPHYSNGEIAKLLEHRSPDLRSQACRIEQVNGEEELCRQTAEAVADGLVVGWFQGRMEWGPRALGNRSIVCDPRRADMKNILNLKIKRRESFRPFAPSILREHACEWFEEEADVPFMTQVYQIRSEKRALVPAVTHVDGSGRLQTVQRGTNPRYYGLIDAFKVLTGVPMVLNTSFNENEPIVCRPDEALECFLRTKMDVLVLTNWIVRRS